MATIESIEQLRAIYAQPGERALKKQLAQLDRHCRGFIALSPYLVLCTSDAAGNPDASPRAVQAETQQEMVARYLTQLY